MRRRLLEIEYFLQFYYFLFFASIIFLCIVLWLNFCFGCWFSFGLYPSLFLPSLLWGVCKFLGLESGGKLQTSFRFVFVLNAFPQFYSLRQTKAFVLTWIMLLVKRKAKNVINSLSKHFNDKMCHSNVLTYTKM
jgi:hypothetical protein